MSSSACTISLADCGRSAGRFSRQRITSAASAGGKFERRLAIDSGTSPTCAARRFCGVRPTNGGCPVSSSYASTPNAYTSARWSMAGSAVACSGDMYAGVPSATPNDVRPPWSALLDAESAFATPKSVTIALPPESNTLSGLMSRCTIPRSCAYANAATISRRIRIASLTGNSPCRARRARSDSPSTNGMVKYGSPFASPAESSGTMCGCWSFAASRISRLNRSSDTCAAVSLGNTFTTTLRPSASSSATNTRDIPPPPSSRSSV